MADDEPTYDVDEDTRTCLTEVLSLAQRTVDLQYDDETADELEQYLVTVATRFGIATTKMTVDVSPDGRTFTVTHDDDDPEPQAKPLWKPTVIEGDKPQA